MRSTRIIKHIKKLALNITLTLNQIIRCSGLSSTHRKNLCGYFLPCSSTIVGVVSSWWIPSSTAHGIIHTCTFCCSPSIPAISCLMPFPSTDVTSICSTTVVGLLHLRTIFTEMSSSTTKTLQCVSSRLESQTSSHGAFASVWTKPRIGFGFPKVAPIESLSPHWSS